MSMPFSNDCTSGIFAGAQAGQYVSALTAVEIALWDLTGKAVGLPIYQLMGGKMRDRIRVYCDSGTNNRNDPKAREFIAQIIENGFTAAKIDIDDGANPARWDRVNWTADNAEIEHMVDKVAFLRESLPKGIELAVDMHGRYDLGTAKRMAKEPEPFKLLWLEEPVPPENVDAMRDARINRYPDLCRREPVSAARFPRTARKARRGHHHARHPEVRWTSGSTQDRGHGPHVLRADGAAHPAVQRRQVRQLGAE
jgi:galactonate dehydratase